jgi:hypothetical protein
MRKTTRAGLLLLCLTLAPSAFADAMPKMHDSWFLPFGLSTAYALHKYSSNGFAGGLELSVVHNDDFFWQGAYADVVRDFENEHTRLSLGPEIGVMVLGIDGGYLLDTGKGTTRHGFCVRPMFSLGIMMLYGRVDQLLGAEHETIGEIGLLFKYPVLLHEGEDPYRPVPEPERFDARPPEAPEPPEGPLQPAPGPGQFAQPPPGSD